MLSPRDDWKGEPGRSLTAMLGAALQRVLRGSYETARIEVAVRPDLGGRMRLIFGGEGVDPERERERVWAAARTASRSIFV